MRSIKIKTKKASFLPDTINNKNSNTLTIE